MSFPNEAEAPEIFVFPPSFGQERLWFLYQLEPTSPSYNVFTAIRLRGQLDQQALQESLHEIVRRHEILRTTFSVIDGQLMQVIAAQRSCQLALKDLRVLPSEQREAEMQREVEHEAERPFDLQHGPLFRATLLLLHPDESVLLLACHHIVFDEWSAGMLKHELSLLYHAYHFGQPSPLPELPLQYADFAVWQRQRVQEPEITRQLAYWQRQFGHDIPLLELPTDHPRRAARSSLGATQRFTLSPALSQLGQQQGATLFMTLLTAFSILLYRYSQQADIVIGTPITNRNQAALEPLLGFFLNTLALRIDLSGQPSFLALLSRVRTLALQAYANQDVPFDQVINALHKNQQEIMRVMFLLEDTADDTLNMHNLVAQSLEVETHRAKFDLILSCTEDRQHGLKGSFTYTTDLFDEATIASLSAHFAFLVEQICQTPTLPISHLPLLQASERQQLLAMWDTTQVNYPRDTCLHTLFEAQVARTPTALAVSTPDEQITYEELNRRANQLARYLHSRGTRTERIVGLCLERSLAFIVAVLGVLKTGAAYLPLDPSDPPERLSTVLTAAQVSLVLTLQCWQQDLPPSASATTICLDVVAEQIALADDENLDLPAHPAQLAYVLYTSGSTGEPKGVMIEHASLVNYLFWVNTSLLGSEPLNLPFTTRPIFDASLKQFLAPLLRGMSVWVFPPDVLQQPRALWLALAHLEHAGFNCVPAFWQAMLDALTSEPQLQNAARNLSHLIIGGEAVSAENIARTLKLLPHVRITNVYGPTEATANASQSSITSADTISLGQPIANTQLYVLDPWLQPVPPGVPGELAIGGVGLARGYLYRPDLTAVSFIPDPFSPQPGQRLYLTGDRVRATHHGALEFLGRIDHQVKIRGYRIELAEIEKSLAQHPAVRQCVVIAHTDAYHVSRLVAYSAVDPLVEHAPRALRSFLQERLPAHMVPALFVILENLPLTPHGKIDRRALPAPDLTQLEREAPMSTPQTQLEQQLAAMWRDLLHIESIGLEDNFFEIGGDSLLSIFFALKAQQAGLPLQPQQVWQYPTLGDLASLLEQSQPPSRTYLPLTQDQQWFLETYLPTHPEHWHLTAILELAQPIMPMHFEQAVQRLMDQHAPFRLRCAHPNTGWQAYLAEPGGMEMATTSWFDLAHLSQTEQRQMITTKLNDEQNRLNTHQGPLMSVFYFDLGEQQPGLLCWHLHFLILDHLVDGALLAALAHQEHASAHASEQASTPQQLAERLAHVLLQPEHARSWPLLTASAAKVFPTSLKEQVQQYLTELQAMLVSDDE